MSKQMDLLELEKCIVSKLWYTATTIVHQRTETIERDKELNDLTHFIESCAEQGLGENRWIAYNLRSLLDNNLETKRILRNEEFVSVLELPNFTIPCRVKEELTKLFESIGTAEENDDVSTCLLSRESLQWLETNLSENPAPIQWIIDGLLCIWLPTRFAQTDLALQDVYFGGLRKFFEFDVKKAENPLKTNSYRFGTKSLGVILSILSKIDLTDSKEDELLNWLYPALIDCSDYNDIELALYSRKKSKFFDNWHEFLDRTYARCEAADNLDNALKISKILLDFDKDSMTSLNANEIFKRTLRRQIHWLTDIFDICYVLLINERYSEVQRFFNENSLLKDFWLLLLFKLLNDCPTESMNSSESSQRNVAICKSMKYLLDKAEKSIYADPTLLRLSATLKNHLNVLNWILECKKSSSIAISAEKYQNFTVKQALHLLCNRSVLAVLKMTTNIHENNAEGISTLLKDSEDSMRTFQAYRAMLSALKAILLSDFYNSKYQEVSENFDEMEKSLGTLFPLNLRLEAIENIFSMLFLRHEDFVDADSASDAEDEDTKEKSKITRESMKYEAGFVCNKYAIRETLHRLKRSVNSIKLEYAEKNKAPDDDNCFVKSLALVSKSLADATWRLELLTSSDFIEKLGTPEFENSQNSTSNFTMLRDETLSYSNSRNKTIFYKPEESSSDESEYIKSDLDGSSEAGSQGNSTNNSGSKRRTKQRKSSSIAESAMLTKESTKRESTLNCMLASKESLVLRCLWRSDYDKASQVIEMFDLKKSPLDGEIKFSRAMMLFRKEMRRQWMNNEAVDSPEVSNKSTLENIRKAVNDGLHTSRSTNQLETFLSAQETSVRLLNSDSTASKVILTMASLDLALTMSRTRQDSLNLSGVTMKYLKSCKKLANTRYYDFFQCIYRHLNESNCDLSIKQFLCDGKIALCVEKAKEKMIYWSCLLEKLRNMREMDYDNDHDSSINDNSLNSREIQFFDDILTICDNGELYLPRLHAHLKLLRDIVPEEAANSYGKDFCLLKTSLDTFIGDQIFRLNLELDEVESIATKLRVNLIHSILVNCCPKLFCNIEKPCETSDKWGSTILNKITEISMDFNDYEPNQCVTEILTELLEALRVSSLSRTSIEPTEAKLLSQSPRIRRILSKTQKFAKLDLSNLSFGNQTLTFFVNVWNLMIIHTILDIWSMEPPVNDLRHEISLTTVSYEIGDLGRVSLKALRSKLLGQSFNGTQYFCNTEELNEPAWQDLDVPHDTRIIFAMINEFNDSPVVRIYRPNTLNEDLNVAAIDYLNNYKKNIDEKDILWLPELINRYNDLIDKKSTVNSINDLNIIKMNSKVAYKSLEYSCKLRFVYSDERSQNFVISKATKIQEFGWQSRMVKTSLLQYLEGHCWLLSYLVQLIHEESPRILENNCANRGRTAALENLVKSQWSKNLKALCDDNQIVAGLRNISLSNDLWNYFQRLLINGETEKCLTTINALPDSLMRSNVEIQRLKDEILASLVTNSRNEEILSYVYQIRDEQIIARLILSNYNNFTMIVCREILSHAINHVNRDKLPQHCKTRINEISRRVIVFEKMLPYCEKLKNNENNWHVSMNKRENTNPIETVRSLIDYQEFELCLEWLEYQAVSTEIHSLVTQDLFIGLLTNNNDQDFDRTIKLLRALPLKKSMNLCSSVIGKLESMEALRFVLEYLLKNGSSMEIEKYRRGLVGIHILEQLEIKERRSYIHLIEQPLFMLEQLLMNCKLENLQRIIIGIREKSFDREYIERFDEILRFYASKSLDFRVAANGEVERVKDASISCNNSRSIDFTMPINIPTKDEWIPNDKARKCSCCRVVIFTMFNRRHHCRRCGRVVCANCSPRRIRLSGYPSNLPVRICNDCERQMSLQLEASQIAPSTPGTNEILEYWRLSLDETHNRTLRDEFSYENAPNISLCLAILNLHSDHEAYSNFLLDRCDEMKSLLRPDSKGRANPEVDHVLIIKMMRSLLLAAKVKCAALGLNMGLTHCDRFLSQVDLITTLINSDCASLIPRIEKNDHLDDHTLPRLRDLLTEKEQWIIALDVSTKSGLDTQGIWAAWGIACLKAGYYEGAREKFAHCLDKVLRDDSDDWVVLSYPSESLNERNKRLPDNCNGFITVENRKRAETSGREGLKNRPNKDPSLLTEILQILDKIDSNERYNQHNTRSRSNGAQEILNTLNSLRSVSQGQYTTVTSNNTSYNYFIYQESLYYLLMYGSFNTILEFFVKHGDYDKCLAYLLENDVEPELFMNIYLRCLRNGCAINLCEAMKAKDSSLLLYKRYLMYICQCLERKQLFNTLLQLQLFMNDYVRAAITCIRFYVNDATSYVDLCSRTNYLTQAQRHLESELRLENFVKKRRKSVSNSTTGGQYSLTLEMEAADIDRHVNTISRQMEIAKFLGKREQEGEKVHDFMNKLACMESEGTYSSKTVPTLFGNQLEKTHLAVLAILCGRDVEEGFGIAFRIIQDYNLRQQKIYSLVGHLLAIEKKINSIEQLIKCCRSSGAPNSNAISDRVLAHCVKLLLDRSRIDDSMIASSKDQIDSLIRIITDVELKIESYIESRQLKAAYLLAVKHSRAQDIRKILKEAERFGQLAIKSICIKWLRQTQQS